MASFRELREQLEPEKIIEILKDYDVTPHYVGAKYIIFPTCCHNLTGGSPKLYYYKNTHMFKCFTDCNALFDIFDLIIKMEELRGRRIGKVQAIKKTGLKINSKDEDELADEAILNDISKLYELNYTEICDINNLDLEPIDPSFLDNRFTFDIEALKTWRNEGISLNTMLYYKITYDPIDNCIIVPQFDADGHVVGVRGRYLDEGVEAKYKPIVYNGKLLSHPKNKTLYGFSHNKEAIHMTKTCILFEGEKSVLKADTIYDGKNIAVAVCGQTISREQIQLLLSIGVSNVILAFDADYRTDKEINEKFAAYKKIASPLKTYFNVSIIIDAKQRLGYKDSPIDKGVEIFNELMRERIYI